MLYRRQLKSKLPYTVLVMVIGMLLAVVPTKFLGNLGHSVSLVKYNKSFPFFFYFFQIKLNVYNFLLKTTYCIYRSIDPHLLLGAFLPALIFESAFATNYHIISKEMGQALLLAGMSCIQSKIVLKI